MATMKAVVRTARADGFYPVYIRVTHRRASSFIKTDKMVTKKELSKSNDIKGSFVADEIARHRHSNSTYCSE